MQSIHDHECSPGGASFRDHDPISRCASLHFEQRIAPRAEVVGIVYRMIGTVLSFVLRSEPDPSQQSSNSFSRSQLPSYIP